MWWWDSSSSCHPWQFLCWLHISSNRRFVTSQTLVLTQTKWIQLISPQCLFHSPHFFLCIHFFCRIASSAWTKIPSLFPLLMLTPVPHCQPPSVTDRMAMPVLIRARLARCAARLNRGLWERALLILASGDGLKMMGAKTSKHSLITLAHWPRPHKHTCTQVSSLSQQCTTLLWCTKTS